MPATLFYSILFSLGPAESNQYVYLVQLQVRALQKLGMLGPGNRYICLADAECAQLLRQSNFLRETIQIELVPKPRSLVDGMALKYLFPFSYPVNGETCVYLDLDVLPMAPTEIHAPDDTLLVLPEGPATDTNYCGSAPLDLPFGVTGGFFAYRAGPRLEALFRELISILHTSEEKHYTLDQPHFNHLVSRHREMVGFIRPDIMSFNGHTNQKTARFYNLCGDPGDGPLHFRKVLEIFLRRFS